MLPLRAPRELVLPAATCYVKRVWPRIDTPQRERLYPRPREFCPLTSSFRWCTGTRARLLHVHVLPRRPHGRHGSGGRGRAAHAQPVVRAGAPRRRVEAGAAGRAVSRLRRRASARWLRLHGAASAGRAGCRAAVPHQPPGEVPGRLQVVAHPSWAESHSQRGQPLIAGVTS